MNTGCLSIYLGLFKKMLPMFGTFQYDNLFGINLQIKYIGLKSIQNSKYITKFSFRKVSQITLLFNVNQFEG